MAKKEKQTTIQDFFMPHIKSQKMYVSQIGNDLKAISITNHTEYTITIWRNHRTTDLPQNITYVLNTPPTAYIKDAIEFSQIATIQELRGEPIEQDGAFQLVSKDQSIYRLLSERANNDNIPNPPTMANAKIAIPFYSPNDTLKLNKALAYTDNNLSKAFSNVCISTNNHNEHTITATESHHLYCTAPFDCSCTETVPFPKKPKSAELAYGRLNPYDKKDEITVYRQVLVPKTIITRIPKNGLGTLTYERAENDPYTVTARLHLFSNINQIETYLYWTVYNQWLQLDGIIERFGAHLLGNNAETKIQLETTAFKKAVNTLHTITEKYLKQEYSPKAKPNASVIITTTANPCPSTTLKNAYVPQETIIITNRNRTVDISNGRHRYHTHVLKQIATTLHDKDNIYLLSNLTEPNAPSDPTVFTDERQTEMIVTFPLRANQ